MSHVIGTSPSSALRVGQGLEAIAAPAPRSIGQHQLQAGQGGLAGKTISVGDGQQRAQTLSLGAKFKAGLLKGLKGTGKAMGLLLAAPVVLAGAAVVGLVWGLAKIPALINNKVLEPRTEQAYKRQHAEALGALGSPPEGGLLDPNNGIRNSGGPLLDKLLAHAQSQHLKLNREEIAELVNVGENIARRLQGPGGDSLPLTIELPDQQPPKSLPITPSTYTARAVSWYMMAQGAKQDLARAETDPGDRTSDMPTNGSFVMKDPGNRMYNFLRSCPSSGARMSTHFAERVGHDSKHKVMGLFPVGKPAQRGIEDYQGKMPGQGGTMLFDKLRPGQSGDEELFVKFESGGCPPYFKKDAQQVTGQGFTRFFAALDRNLGHSVSFLKSKSAGAANSAQVLRQEHVDKGVLKKDINAGFSALVSQAIGRGVINGDAKAIGQSVHKMGLPYVLDAVATIREAAVNMESDQFELRERCDDLLGKIQDEANRLGAMGPTDIERRGAEVHISLTSQGRLDNASGEP